MTGAGQADRGAALEQELEQRTRRVHQLMGEREQLATLLAGRDAEIQRLNRELGARAAHDPVPRDGLVEVAGGAIAGLWRRLRGLRWPIRRRRSPATGEAAPAAAAASAPALVPWVKEHPPRPILAAVLFGLSAAEIERILEVVDSYCQRHGMLPLLLTDDDGFGVFRGRRSIVEFLPPEATRGPSAPERDWELYLLRRLALIRRKWQPIRIVTFGARAAEVARLWRESPFEEAPIPAALGAPNRTGDPAAWAGAFGDARPPGAT